MLMVVTARLQVLTEIPSTLDLRRGMMTTIVRGYSGMTPQWHKEDRHLVIPFPVKPATNAQEVFL